MEQVLGVAKQLVQRLNHHDNAADALISDASNLEAQLIAMKEFREEVTKLNEISRHRQRSTLILGSQVENQHIQELKNENRELHLSLTEHQSALELIMNKYREQVVNLLTQKGLNKAALENMNKNSGDVGALTEKVTEMAAVMQIAAKADEETEYLDAENVAKLAFENKALRELLHISDHPKKEIEKLKTKANLEYQLVRNKAELSDTPSFELDSSADEMEHQTGTVKRKAKNANNVEEKIMANGNDNNAEPTTKEAVQIPDNGNSKDVHSSNHDESCDEKGVSGVKPSSEECMQLFDEILSDAGSDIDLADELEEKSGQDIVSETVENPEEIADVQNENSYFIKDLVKSDAQMQNSNFSDKALDSVDSDDSVSGLPGDEKVDSRLFNTTIDKDKSVESETGSQSETDAVCGNRQENDTSDVQFLDLYNSEGILLDGAEDVYSKKGSQFDGKVGGIKIRKSTKQKKVLQADLKKFFENDKCSEEDVAVVNESISEASEESSEQESSIVDDLLQQFDSIVDENEADQNQKPSDKDSINTVEGHKHFTQQEMSVGALSQMNNNTLKNENLVKSEAIACPVAESGIQVSVMENEHSMPHEGVNVACKKEMSSDHKETEQSDSIDSGRSSLSIADDVKKIALQAIEDEHSIPHEGVNVSSDNEDVEQQRDSIDSGRSSPDGAKRTAHRTIELDFSDSDSDDTEVMIEDQFADIIAEANEDSSSEEDFSDEEQESDEPTEEELVGDLEEGGEHVVSHWVRPVDEFAHLEESWLEQNRKADGLADELAEKEINESSDEKEPVTPVNISSAADLNDKKDNDDNFPFTQASYQIDQFTGGSIKAKYAKRKSYQNASKASAVTLSVDKMTNQNVNSTDSSSKQLDAGKGVDDTEDGQVTEKQVNDIPLLAVNSSELIVSSSEESLSDECKNAPNGSTSESSSGEIDPSVFKRRLSVDPPREKNQSDCAGHLTDLLSDLDATLALSEDNEDDD